MHKSSLAVLLVAALIGSAAHAQQYPTRSLRFISPFPPGGGNDMTAGMIAQALTEGQNSRASER